MSTFSEWTLSTLEKRFNLTLRTNLPDLESWLATPIEISDLEHQILTLLKKQFKLKADVWNEQELAMNAIGPLLTLVDFGSHNIYNFFAERNLTATVDNETLIGNPDGIVASGWREPEAPFFCLHEYKRESAPNADPFGQCLAAMLAARQLNQNTNLTIYGCAVVGRYWRFLVLQNNQYAISEPYIITRDDIFSIFKILKTLKIIVQTYLNI